MVKLGVICFSLIMVTACGGPPSERTMSSLLQDYVERQGNYRISSIRIISVEEIKDSRPPKDGQAEGKSYVVNVIFSFDSVKEVRRGFTLIYPKGVLIHCEGSFAVMKKEGRWQMKPIKFDREI
jgi:hypothetical protein